MKNGFSFNSFILVSLLGVASAFAAETPSKAAGTQQTSDAASPPAKVKYQAGKDVNFEEMLIQGQLRRPEISVVTGSTQQGADGLLRLRENFTDRIQMDAGEDL